MKHLKGIMYLYVFLLFLPFSILAAEREAGEKGDSLTLKTQCLQNQLAKGWKLTSYTNDFSFFNLLFYSPSEDGYRFLSLDQRTYPKMQIRNILKGTNLYEKIHFLITSGGIPSLSNNTLIVKSITGTNFIDLTRSSDTDVFMWEIKETDLAEYAVCTDVTYDFFYIMRDKQTGNLKYKYEDLTNKTDTFIFSNFQKSFFNATTLFSSVCKYPYFVYSNIDENTKIEVMLFDSKTRTTQVLLKEDRLLETLDSAVIRRVLMENDTVGMCGDHPFTFLCRKHPYVLSITDQQEAAYFTWYVECLNGGQLGYQINAALDRFLDVFLPGQYRELVLPGAKQLWSLAYKANEYLEKNTDPEITSSTYPLDISFSYDNENHELNVKPKYALSSIGTFEVICSLKINPNDLYGCTINNKVLENIQPTYEPSFILDENMLSFKLRTHVFNELKIPFWQIQSSLYKVEPQNSTKTGKAPIVLCIQGGPFTIKNDPFEPYFTFLSRQGFAVLVPNYPGSTHTIDSFVKAKGECIELTNRYLEFLIEQIRTTDDTLDTEKIAIVGGSYGGMVALQHAVGNAHLKNIAAVVSLYGPTDFSSSYGENNRDTLNNYLFQGDDHIKTMSPISHAAQLTAPTLIVQGKDDQRVGYEDVKNFINCVTEHNSQAPLSFLRFDHMGHGFSTEEQLNAYQMVVTQFLRHHLNYGDGPGIVEHRERIKNLDTHLTSAFGVIEWGRNNLGLPKGEV